MHCDMKTQIDNSHVIDLCPTGVHPRNAAVLAEFHRDVMGMHQEIDLNQTEEDLLEELTALSRWIHFTSLIKASN